MTIPTALFIYAGGALLGLLLLYWVIRLAVTDALRTGRREARREAASQGEGDRYAY